MIAPFPDRCLLVPSYDSACQYRLIILFFFLINLGPWDINANDTLSPAHFE